MIQEDMQNSTENSGVVPIDSQNGTLREQAEQILRTPEGRAELYAVIEQNPSILLSFEETHSFSFRGPLPHPDVLNKYKDEDRKLLISMAQDESTHRREVEKHGMEAAIFRDKYIAFVVCLVCMFFISAAVICSYLGAGVGVVSAIMAPLVIICGLLVIKSYPKKDHSPEDSKSLEK